MKSTASGNRGAGIVIQSSQSEEGVEVKQEKS